MKVNNYHNLYFEEGAIKNHILTIKFSDQEEIQFFIVFDEEIRILIKLFCFI
jgi:hypothetical protein